MAAGATKESVAALLKGAGVEFQLHEHAAVESPEQLAAALPNAGVVATKSLFLRDKKKRTYVVTHLLDTNVIPTKILSGRLGLGSGNLNPAPEDALSSTLGAPTPAAASPLGLANADACKHTLLLLDAKLRAAGRFLVPAMTNAASVALDAAGLEAFLKSVGREAIWVDLEVMPKITPDNPPDLKSYADAVPIPPKAGDGAADGSSSGAGAAAAAAGSSGKAPAAAGGGAAASSGKAPAAPAAAGAHKHHGHHHGHHHKKAAPVPDAAKHLAFTDVEARADQIITLVSAALAGAPPAAAAEAAGGGAAEGAYLLERLRADVEVALSAFKNAAYTSGYTAGKAEVVAAATRKYA